MCWRVGVWWWCGGGDGVGVIDGVVAVVGGGGVGVGIDAVVGVVGDPIVAHWHGLAHWHDLAHGHKKAQEVYTQVGKPNRTQLICARSWV